MMARKLDKFDRFTIKNIGVAFDDNGIITYRKRR